MEVIMAALDVPLLSGCYRVEVSGWDEDEMFFVEKSQLAGNDITGRHISLQHKLAEGTIVFVRLLHSTAYQQSCPAAYQVEFIGNVRPRPRRLHRSHRHPPRPV
jgi:hypothetical protein